MFADYFSEIRLSHSQFQYNRLLSFGLDRHWRRALLGEARRRLGNGPGDYIMDLAAGTLDVSIAFSREFSEKTILALDLSPAMLQHGLSKLGPAEKTRIIPLNGNALALPTKTGALAAVLLAFGLRNMRPRARALEEIWRSLAPGGHVFVLEFSCPKGTAWPLRLYLERVMPWLGGLISQDKAAYAYLAKSIKEFPGPLVIKEELAQAGFLEVFCKKLFPGLVFLYSARKP